MLRHTVHYGTFQNKFNIKRDLSSMRCALACDGIDEDYCTNSPGMAGCKARFNNITAHHKLDSLMS